jgi:hypothetical protein
MDFIITFVIDIGIKEIKEIKYPAFAMTGTVR